MKVDLNLLAVFDAVYRERSVTLAAVRLGRSQSTVSAALDRLRQVLGDDLFLRQRYGVLPTARADAIALDVARVVADAEQLLLPAPQFDAGSSDRAFNISASTYFECLLAPRLISALRSEAPNVTLRVTAQGARRDTEALMSGDLDLALGRFLDNEERLVQSTILDDGLTCLAPRDLVSTNNRLTKSTFEKTPHVVVQPSGRWRSGVYQAVEAVGLTRNVAISVSHFQALPAVLKEIGGLATLPIRIAEYLARDPGLAVVAPPRRLGRFPMHITWHPRFREDPGHQWLRRLIAGICNSMSATTH